MSTETVTPKLRARTRELLGAKLIDRYTCEEIGPIGMQCAVREDRYHVSITNAFVEVVDERGRSVPPGTEGKVLITGLNSYADHFIRYDVDDIATLQRGCECGFAGPVLRDLLGRRRFLIRMPDGSRRAVGTPARLWLSVAPFREQRLVQRREGELTAEVVLDRPLTDEESRRLADLLSQEIGGGLVCRVEQVQRIDWTVSPKRQDVISLI